MDREVIRKAFIWIVAIALIVLLPTSLGTQHQSTARALVLGFAVDKEAEEYEVAMQVLIPQYKQSFSEKIEVVSAKGVTIDLALDGARLKIGKKLGVAHANMIVLSEKVLGEDVMRVLDYFYRDRYLGNYSIVLCTGGSAKELLETSSQTDNASLNSLVNIVKYNDENLLGSPSNLHTIATGYYSPAHTCLIPHIELDKEGADSGGGEESGSTGSSGGEGGGSQGGESGSDAQGSGGTKIKNDGSVVVLKDGKSLVKLSGEEFRGFSWLFGNTKGVILRLGGISDDIYTDADVMVEVDSARAKLRYDFSDLGKPIINADVSVHYKISSVVQSEYDARKYADYVQQDTASLENAIKALIQSEVQSALVVAKELNFDLWNVYDRFHQFHTREFARYLASVEGDYMSGLEIFVDVHSSEIRL